MKSYTTEPTYCFEYEKRDGTLWMWEGETPEALERLRRYEADGIPADCHVAEMFVYDGACKVRLMTWRTKYRHADQARKAERAAAVAR